MLDGSLLLLIFLGTLVVEFGVLIYLGLRGISADLRRSRVAEAVPPSPVSPPNPELDREVSPYPTENLDTSEASEKLEALEDCLSDAETHLREAQEYFRSRLATCLADLDEDIQSIDQTLDDLRADFSAFQDDIDVITQEMRDALDGSGGDDEEEESLPPPPPGPSADTEPRSSWDHLDEDT